MMDVLILTSVVFQMLVALVPLAKILREVIAATALKVLLETHARQDVKVGILSIDRKALESIIIFSLQTLMNVQGRLVEEMRCVIMNRDLSGACVRKDLWGML